MAQAARDRYSYSYSYRGAQVSSSARSSQAEPQKPVRERYRVIPGEGQSKQRAKGLPKVVISNFSLFVAILLVLTVVCGVRVFLSVATVQALQSSATVQEQIEEARATGNDMEIRHSVLAKPARIQKEAAKLGMSAPKSTERIAVALPAKTKYNENGTISISATIKSIENSVASK